MEIKVFSPQELLHQVDAKLGILSLIERDSALGHANFQKYVMPVLLGLSASVMSSPLNREYYAYENGALEYGLIVSMMALRIAEGSIFTQGTVEDRALYEPQYKFAAFCASIASVPAFLFSGVTITNEDGEIWSPLSTHKSMHHWLSGSKTFHANWFNKSVPVSRMLGAGMSWKLFPEGIWAKFDSRIVAQMFESINPPDIPSPGESRITAIVRKSHEKAIDLYQKSIENQFNGNAHAPNASMMSESMAEIKADALLHKNASIGRTPTLPAEAKAVAVTPKKPSIDISKIDRSVLDLFDAITTDPKYSTMKADLNVTNLGVELPLKFIAYGLEVRGTVRLLESCGLVIEKREGLIVLRPDVAHLLVK